MDSFHCLCMTFVTYDLLYSKYDKVLWLYACLKKFMYDFLNIIFVIIVDPILYNLIYLLSHSILCKISIMITLMLRVMACMDEALGKASK